jgi:hypothetical protein
VAGEALRNIAERVSISPPALLRHKSHVATSIGKAQAKREETFGASLLADMRRLKERLWAQLDAAETDGDRGAFTALAREVRQTIGGFFELAERAALCAAGVSLASASNDAILGEAERRKLPVRIVFNVAYTSAPTRFDKVVDVEPQP